MSERIAELEKRLDAVLALHREFGVYDECGHEHNEGDPGVIEVEDVGFVCEEGRVNTLCWECYTEDGEVTEDGQEGEFPCRTRLAALGQGQKP